MNVNRFSTQEDFRKPCSDERAFWRSTVEAVRRGQSLSQEHASRMMEIILCANATAEEMEQYLRAMAAKDITVDELVGSVHALRAVTQHIETGQAVLDTCGTGGDGLGTFNISTAAALVVAASGQPVAKHGNRSSSGGTGSADVLDALGIAVEAGPPEVLESLRRHRFAFLFAPAFRPRVEGLAEARMSIKGPTLFNLAGPLCNPTGPAFQVIGTYNEGVARTIAESVLALGTQRTLVVTGPQGIDELLPSDGNVLFEVSGGRMTRREVRADEHGLSACNVSELAGGDAKHNAAIIEVVLAGERGPRRSAVVMNAGLGLLAAGRASNLKESYEQASMAIDDGRAFDLLNALRTEARDAR